MAWNYSNTSVETTLTVDMSIVATTATVATVTGLPVTFPYSLILDINNISREVVSVTAAAGNVLTVTRAQDGTSASAHITGASVTHGVVARDLAEPQTHIAAFTGVHGISGNVVGTTGAQTLTNKTISGSANTLSNVPGSALVGTVSTALLSGNLNAATVTGTFASITESAAAGTVGVTVTSTGGARTQHLVDITDPANGKSLVFGDDGTVTVDDGDLVVDTRRAPAAAATTARIYSKNATGKPALILDRATANTNNLQEWRANGAALSTMSSAGALSVVSLSTTGNASVGGNLSVTGIGQTLFAYKPTDQTVNNSATMQNDNALVVSVTANAVYRVEMRLRVASGATPDFKYQFTLPAGATGLYSAVTSATGPLVFFVFDDNMSLPQSTEASASTLAFGLLTVGATAGNVQLQWAQNTATVSDTTVLNGSYLYFTRMA